MINIVLPFPPSELKPNRSNGHHWTKVKKVKDEYKLACWKACLPWQGALQDHTGRVKLKIMFYKPANRGDLDGMLSSLKSGLDMVAKCVGIDDKMFKPIEMDDQVDKLNARVEIIIGC